MHIPTPRGPDSDELSAIYGFLAGIPLTSVGWIALLSLLGRP